MVTLAQGGIGGFVVWGEFASKQNNFDVSIGLLLQNPPTKKNATNNAHPKPK
jgi:hypothetical protein